MKNSLAIILLVMAMIGCKPTVPSKYIQPGELEDILYDYHMGQAMADEEYARSSEENAYHRNVYFWAVLKKHHVTEAEFDSSLVYYYSHADRLKDIYQKVVERLNDEAKALGASVGDINKYSAYSTTGDTANVWQNETNVLLTPTPTNNRYDIYVKADTSYYKGDVFMFQFMADFFYQSGKKDATVYLAAKYEGDSIMQTISPISNTGQSQVRLPHYRDGKLKELRGFIYLNNNEHDSEARKILFINQIQLIRFHQKQKTDEPKATKEVHKADSLSGTADSTRNNVDSVRRRDIQRQGNSVLSSGKGASLHRVDN